MLGMNEQMQQKFVDFKNFAQGSGFTIRDAFLGQGVPKSPAT